MRTAYTTPSATFAALSSAWLSACAQPWTAWQGWSQLMGSQWQQWLKTVGSVPNVWLPALAAERRGQPPAIDFFLPWLQRGESSVVPLDVHGAETAMRLMMRAALPLFGAAAGTSTAAEDVKVDPVREKGPVRVLDLVARTSNVVDAEVVSPKPAAPVEAPKAASSRTTRAKPAARKPAAAAKTTAAKTTAAKTASAKPAAAKPAPAAAGVTAGEVKAKPAPRRVRKPAAPPADKT
ncbi:MAG: hypothetical protein C0607_05050 [Azoarcus sp.]|nr:MAG: hypothetical protein C0607_05050 [Azoarcus sp.]